MLSSSTLTPTVIHADEQSESNSQAESDSENEETENIQDISIGVPFELDGIQYTLLKIVPFCKFNEPYHEINTYTTASFDMILLYSQYGFSLPYQFDTVYSQIGFGWYLLFESTNVSGEVQQSDPIKENNLVFNDIDVSGTVEPVLESVVITDDLDSCSLINIIEDGQYVGTEAAPVLSPGESCQFWIGAYRCHSGKSIEFLLNGINLQEPYLMEANFSNRMSQGGERSGSTSR